MNGGKDRPCHTAQNQIYTSSQLAIIVYRDAVERAKQVPVRWRVQPVVVARRARCDHTPLLLQVQRARLLEVSEIGGIRAVGRSGNNLDIKQVHQRTRPQRHIR